MTRCVDHFRANPPKKVYDRVGRSDSNALPLGRFKLDLYELNRMDNGCHHPRPDHASTSDRMTISHIFHLVDVHDDPRVPIHLDKVWVREPKPPTAPKDDRRYPPRSEPI